MLFMCETKSTSDEHLIVVYLRDRNRDNTRIARLSSLLYGRGVK